MEQIMKIVHHSLRKPWLRALAPLAAIYLVAALVYATGGTRFAFAHLMYLPILGTAVLWGARGGAAAGLLAGLLVGPFMPLDPHTGETQQTLNWLFRTACFSGFGFLFGSLVDIRQRQMQRIRQVMTHEPLTGLPNQYACQQRLKSERGLAAFGLLRIANYYQIMDILGQDACHKLMVRIEQWLRDATGGEADIYLMSPRELALVFPSDGAFSQETMQSVVDGMKKAFRVEDFSIYADVRAGLACRDKDNEPAENITHSAYVALHHADSRGQSLVVFDKAQPARGRKRIDLLAEIPAALKNDQFRLHYQPKIELRTGRVVRVEALLRWRHPRLGDVPPADYVFDIESTGLIHDITRWVAATALRQLSRWRAQGMDIILSFNLSTRNLQCPTLAPYLSSLRKECHLPPRCVEVEITENSFMLDPDACLKTLNDLKEAGFLLAIDDFGTGYCSLSYLRKLPIDSIKIAREFVCRIDRSPVDQKIVKSTLNLARGLGLKTIAEGIETEEIYRMLRKMGCEIGQGFYFSRPLPPETLRQRISIENGAGIWSPEEGGAERPASRV